MPTVTFVLGLCGSGKSWHAERLVLEGKAAGKVVTIIDENLLSPDYPQLGLLLRELSAGKDCVVTEIELCREEVRDYVVCKVREAVADVEIKWLCIENNLEKANRNCRQRRERDPEAHVRINCLFSPRYTYPKGAEVVPIWSPDDSDCRLSV